MNAPMWPKPGANSPRPDRFARPPSRTSRGAAMTAYDPNNIFAKILRGEFPCYKVYEDDHVLAFLDIMPRSPGHTLVIPKAPARNILDIKVEDYLHVARATHKIAAAAKQIFA